MNELFIVWFHKFDLICDISIKIFNWRPRISCVYNRWNLIQIFVFILKRFHLLQQLIFIVFFYLGISVLIWIWYKLIKFVRYLVLFFFELALFSIFHFPQFLLSLFVLFDQFLWCYSKFLIKLVAVLIENVVYLFVFVFW